MSCYNASRWLGESIESVLNQSYDDFEFIIVDDGSKDDTPAIIERYATTDDRIVAISKANTGLADSLNVGISQARGEWIARQDADDISAPARLEKQVQLVMANRNIVFVGTGLIEIDEFGREYSTYRYPTAHSRLLKNLHTAQKFPPHSSAFYRRDVAQSISGYRTRFRRSQDRDLWLRLSALGELACLDEPLVRVRTHPGQISNDESGRRQRVDATMAMTSYCLCNTGASDPVDSDDEIFQAFYSWLERELSTEGGGGFQDEKERLKRLFKWRRNGAPANWIALSVVAHPKFLIRLVCERLWGSSVAVRLARKWVKLQIK